jgi:hypothetical protein
MSYVAMITSTSPLTNLFFTFCHFYLYSTNPTGFFLYISLVFLFISSLFYPLSFPSSYSKCVFFLLWYYTLLTWNMSQVFDLHLSFVVSSRWMLSSYILFLSCNKTKPTIYTTCAQQYCYDDQSQRKEWSCQHDLDMVIEYCYCLCGRYIHNPD